MRKIKKMQADHVYLIRGASVSNSPFFETEDDCKYFLKLADEHLEPYLKINNFQNNRDGWLMIISTNSSDAIKKAYKLRRSHSKKCKKVHEHKEIWRMLSDQVRILLSTYVKGANARSGRSGGKVKSNYERFVFESTEEVLEMKEKMESERVTLGQRLKRYRPSKKMHSLKKRSLRSSIYMSCAQLGRPEKIVELGLKCLCMALFLTDVLRQLTQATLLYHFPT